ncbi:hypothetical protein MAR_029538 [Mya arenaria]|uniref:Uncharacterized protein n=1 Tax=Mya arenaria TaxID=6604 RepID=A0ABY7DIV1_MYAAR|nr:hypothetical protein MAR_029538 [Mya arenaria]
MKKHLKSRMTIIFSQSEYFILVVKNCSNSAKQQNIVLIFVWQIVILVEDCTCFVILDSFNKKLESTNYKGKVWGKWKNHDDQRNVYGGKENTSLVTQIVFLHHKIYHNDYTTSFTTTVWPVKSEFVYQYFTNDMTRWYL